MNDRTESSMTTFDVLRQDAAGDPAKIAQIDSWEAWKVFVEDHAPTAIPPCPTWCRYFDTLTPRSLYKLHEYDSVSDRGEPLTFSRFHVENETGMYVCQEEFNRDGVVTLGRLHISITARDGCEEATSEQARAMAAELLAAADRLDAIADAS